MSWLQVCNELPPEGKYVLVRLSKDNWHDDTDQDNVVCKVAKLKKGISKQERSLLPELPDLLTCESERWKIYTKQGRKYTYTSADEFGNNLVPYNWEEFGPSQYFGQEVTHWMPIPDL